MVEIFIGDDIVCVIVYCDCEFGCLFWVGYYVYWCVEVDLVVDFGFLCVFFDVVCMDGMCWVWGNGFFEMCIEGVVCEI